MGEWVYHVSVVVPDADRRRILVQGQGDERRLPFYRLEAFYVHLYQLTRRIRDAMGADMVVLQLLARRHDEATKQVDALVLMDNLTPDWKPPDGARWIDGTELAAIRIEAWMRPMLQAAVEDLKAVPPANRPAWFMQGWYQQAAMWMGEVLAEKGYGLLRPPEQFKLGAISAVLRAETSVGNVFFKVALALPLFGNEPLLTEALGRLYPTSIQAPMAIDRTRRWMLTEDIGEELRESHPSLEQLRAVVQQYARLQVDSVRHIDTLLAAGCLDRRLPVLAGQIDPLLADEGCYGDLTEEEYKAFQNCGDDLKALCQRLGTFAMPEALTHGDFHAGNIAIQGERIRFFDWTDACIAHPFFDVALLIGFEEPARATTLREVYLAEWAAYEPPERLHEAFRLASILGALHQVVSYQGIYNGIEASQRMDWATGVPFWARRVMELLKAEKQD